MYVVTEKQTDVTVKRAQIVYLVHELKWAYDKVAELTGYAVSTVRNYAVKYFNLLDWAKEIFSRVSKKVRKSKYNDMIDANGFDIDTVCGEICYLFEFYTKEKVFICSKVGTTTRTVRERLKEELGHDTYKKMGAEFAVVHRVYKCGEIPAEGLESRIRAEYIKKYPKAFKKNDRFIGEYFDFKLCDAIAKEYLS